MPLEIFIGLRYLFSRSRIGAVGWVSFISVLALAVVSASLVIVLSVYNGYVEMILQGSQDLNADLVIRPSQGKVLNIWEDERLQTVVGLPYVETVSGELVALGILQRDNAQSAVPVVGIDSSYTKVLEIDRYVNAGALPKESGSDSTAQICLGMATALTNGYVLGASDVEAALYFPRREGLINPLAPASAFSSVPIEVVGILEPLREDVDRQVYAQISTLWRLLSYQEGTYTSLLVKLREGVNLQNVQKQLYAHLGADYRVLNREEQQPELSYLIRTERWMIYLIMSFILLLAGFSLASSLVMMIMEKEADLSTLKALGLSSQRIASIFVSSGIFISVLGSLVGLLIGVLISLSQAAWGWVTVGQGLMAMPLPIVVEGSDILLVLLMTLGISILVAWIPNLFLLRRTQYMNE